MAVSFCNLDRPEVMRGFFHDYKLQDAIIGGLKSRCKCVDPYDGATFYGDEIQELKESVKSIISEVEGKSSDWPLNEDECVSYYKRGAAYGLDLAPPRDQLLKDLNDVLRIVSDAIENGGQVVFYGD